MYKSLQSKILKRKKNNLNVNKSKLISNTFSIIVIIDEHVHQIMNLFEKRIKFNNVCVCGNHSYVTIEIFLLKF